MTVIYKIMKLIPTIIKESIKSISINKKKLIKFGKGTRIVVLTIFVILQKKMVSSSVINPTLTTNFNLK